MSSTLYAGVSKRVINPDIGTAKAGLRLFADPIQAIESDLTGTALVLSCEGAKVAIVAVDLCVISYAEATAIRARIAETLETPVSHVMLNLSHNHSSPALPGWVDDTPEQTRLKERYRRRLQQWLVEAATEADANRQPVRIGADWGESHIGIYRRETGPDGRDVLGEVPDHPIDSDVGVIRVDDLDGNALATVFSYACHPVTVGPRSMVASTDFPGPARDVLENALGGTAIFLQGCGGNINPRVGIGYEVDCSDNKNRIGFALGAEALRVASGIRTHVAASERTPLGNIPNILFRRWEPITTEGCRHLSAVEETVELEFIELPPLEQAEAIRDQWHATLADRRSGSAQDWEVRVASKFSEWADRLVEAVRDGHPTLDLGIQAIRINDIALVGLNMEVFFETGMAIKSRSPFAHTEVLGYTNGSAGYLPRAEDHPEGGWKVTESYAVPDLLFQAYTLPVALHPDSEQKAVEEALAVLARLE